MGTAALRTLLISLCANSPWKYAVFWKLKHLDQAFLTWEDGYCDYSKQREHFKNKLDDACSSMDSKVLTFEHHPGISDGSSIDFSIGFAIGYMSGLQYALGEGVIGRAALSGNDNWIFFDSSVSGEFCPFKPEFPEEWHLQVVAGIKTILLVPLLPHGVLQLGSFDTEFKSLLTVSEIKQRFESFLSKENLAQSTSPSNLIGPSSSSMGPIFVLNKDEARSWSAELLSRNVQYPDSEVTFLDNLMDSSISSNDENMHAFVVQNMSEAIISHIQEISEHSPGSDPSDSSFCPLNLSETVNQETMLDLLDLSYDMDQIINCSLIYGVNQHEETENVYPPEDVLEEPPTVDCELHNGIGLYFSGEDHGISWDLYEPNFHKSVSPDFCSTDDLINSFDPLPLGYCGYFDGGIHQDLVQDATPGLFEQLDDITFCTVSSGSPLTLSSASGEAALEAVPPSNGSMLLNEEKKVKKRSYGASGRSEIQVNPNKKARGNIGPKSRPRDRQLIQDRLKELRDLVPNGEKCSIDSLLDKAIRHMQFLTNVTEQAEKLSHTVDKEGGDGQIWTRLVSKQTLLRSSVPSRRIYANSCVRRSDRVSWSDEVTLINNKDELLLLLLLLKRERVKLILNSNVTNSPPPSLAPLPREITQTKHHGEGKWRLISVDEKGASCTAGDFEQFPISVKDLPRPGFMLIEMACSEQELFFEITKVVSRLGLTILKSVMETNSRDTRAQFIVEAPRGFEKMEIFFPLIHLLQRHRNNMSAPRLV